MAMNHTEAFNTLEASWSAMVTNWETNSIKAFFASIFTYLFGVQNWELLFILIIMVLIDTALGMAKGYSSGQFTSRGMGKILYKLPLYTALLLITHLSVHIVFIHGNIDLSILDNGAYLFLTLRELISSKEKLAFFGINYTAPFQAVMALVNKKDQPGK